MYDEDEELGNSFRMGVDEDEPLEEEIPLGDVPLEEDPDLEDENPDKDH